MLTPLCCWISSTKRWQSGKDVISMHLTFARLQDLKLARPWRNAGLICSPVTNAGFTPPLNQSPFVPAEALAHAHIVETRTQMQREGCEERCHSVPSPHAGEGTVWRAPSQMTQRARGGRGTRIDHPAVCGC